MIRAAFLDRDGVVNVDRGYVYRIADFEFCEGIFDLCRLLQDRRYKLVIVSNQSGIARGYYTLDQLETLTVWMHDRFEDQGVFISKFYFCPHHPTEGTGGFTRNCDCRKPKPGMLLRAKEELGLDLRKSLLIGDSASDIEAGLNAGVGRNFLIGPESGAGSEAIAGTVFDSLVAITDFLTGSNG